MQVIKFKLQHLQDLPQGLLGVALVEIESNAAFGATTEGAVLDFAEATYI